MPDISPIGEQSVPIADQQSIEENRGIVAKIRRTRRVEDIQHWGFVILFWIIIIGVGSMLVIIFWHHICSKAYCWFTDEQINKIWDFLTKGFLGAICTNILRVKSSENK